MTTSTVRSVSASTSTVDTPGPDQPAAPLTSADLVSRLRAVVRGEVDESRRRRAEYSTDASNYRVVPLVVVYPKDADDVIATLKIARETKTPITARGAGTSIAGNAIGTGIVLDFSVHMNKVLSIDPETKTAVVQPGVILTDLQKAARPHGLRFGPDPSTQNRCTLAGMIGNNACGSRALAYGRTSDNVIAMDVIDGLGRRFTAGQDLTTVPGLEDFAQKIMPLARTEMGKFNRQVSGYSLEHLLPENGRDLAKALVGSEGTCAIALEATVQLVDMPRDPALVVLGYTDMAAAADAVPNLLPHSPIAIEGIDARLVDVVRLHRGEAAVPPLPAGGGWLMVEVAGENPEETQQLVENIIRDGATDHSLVVPDPQQAAALWNIRADGAGLGGRTPAGEQAWPGWEDAAVPPEKLGLYLREFEALMEEHGLDGLIYGHFGDGCLHVRIDMPLEDAPERMRPFLEAAAMLVARHGGSISGEHGDGRARSELLQYTYSRDVLAAFKGFKNLFDPENILNPGVLVDPAPLDVDLRRPAAAKLRRTGGLAFLEDGEDFTRAVHRCVGVGKCRADSSAAGGFMCPSYLATRDEKDSTRGRARVLQEMANGDLVSGGWSSPEVEESLDLCLSCKACSSDCPAGVDMATYKTEVLYHKYRGKRRPITHYLLGQLPRWTSLVGKIPGMARIANAFMSIGWLRKLVFRFGGMDPRREMASFAITPFHKQWAKVQKQPAAKNLANVPATQEVLLWVDSFSDAFTPDLAHDAVRVLRAAGYRVRVSSGEVCCGLTWITTGQLDGARKKLRGLLDLFGPLAEAGIPIVGLEPSCTAVLRTDLVELFPNDPRAAAIRDATLTFAQALRRPRADGSVWEPPQLAGLEVVAQPHCHQHATAGFSADRALLTAAGAQVSEIAGCCGLAGNWGMEKGHYDVSVAVAENGMLPALRAASDDAVLLADGFSCRTQATQLAQKDGVHLATLLAPHLD